MFNTSRLDAHTLPVMADDYNRLIQAAQALLGISTPSEIGRLIGAYDQKMTNWKTRGIPRAEIMDISEKIGCDPFWLRDGKGTMTIAAYPSASTRSYQVREKLPAQDLHAEVVYHLSAMDIDDQNVWIATITAASNKARKVIQEKSDRKLAEKASDPPLSDRRTA